MLLTTKVKAFSKIYYSKNFVYVFSCIYKISCMYVYTRYTVHNTRYRLVSCIHGHISNADQVFNMYEYVVNNIISMSELALRSTPGPRFTCWPKALQWEELALGWRQQATRIFGPERHRGSSHETQEINNKQGLYGYMVQNAVNNGQNQPGSPRNS